MPDGFVHLRDVDDSIEQDVRYATTRNFTGQVVPGYAAGECILLRGVALALKNAQANLECKGLRLKVYDCYRPQRASRSFLAWTQLPTELPYSRGYHPHLPKAQLAALGYIAATSQHATGAAVDLAIVPSTAPKQTPVDPAHDYQDCTAAIDRREPDNALDSGTGFDCFDPKSHTTNTSLSAAQRAARLLLRTTLDRHGFANYDKEWWHFRYRAIGRDAEPRDFVIGAAVAGPK